MPSLLGAILKPYVTPKKEREEELPEAGLEEEGYFDIIKPYKKAAIQKLKEQGIPETALATLDTITPDSPFDLVGMRKQPSDAAIRQAQRKSRAVPAMQKQAAALEKKGLETTGYHNCRTFAQCLTGISDIEKQPQAKSPEPGHILWWGNDDKYSHVAVALDKDRAIEISEWGDTPKVRAISDIAKEYGSQPRIYSGKSASSNK